MTFGLTAAGFVIKTFDDIRTSIDDYIRANLDNGLILSDDTALGNCIAAVSLELSRLWELAQDMYQSGDPEVSLDWALDQLAAVTGTTRSGWSKSTVVGQVTLNPGKALPAGSIANLTGRQDVQFETLALVPATTGGGTFDVTFQALENGATEVLIGQLSEITVAVPGWTAVTNAALGTPGMEPEADSEFRDKRDRELFLPGSTNVSAIRAAVSAVSGVLDVQVTETYVPPYIYVTVRGGADADVAAAILASKAGGVGTVGTTVQYPTDSEGTAHEIRFTRASALTFYAEVIVEKSGEWLGADSITNIKNYMSDWLNGFNVGQDVVYDRLKAEIFEEAGVYKISTLKIGFAPSPTTEGDLTVTDTEYVTSVVGNISVTTT